MELQANGTLLITDHAVKQLTGRSTIFFAKDLLGDPDSVMDSRNPLLRHKTTWRKTYDDAWQAAVGRGGFDAIFTNERGEVTEGGRSNIFALIDGRWFTPPISCGVLPGVMRSTLLNDPSWRVTECVILPSDLRRAQQIIMVNALRGVVETTLCEV